MAEFLTTKKILGYLDDVIDRAKKELVLVSPFIKLSPDYKVRLRSASLRGVHITIIHGKDEMNPEDLEYFANLENLELYFFEFLHAKCFFNETSMIISSMNLYDFSAKNIEIGVLVNRVTDSDLYEQCYHDMLGLRHSAFKRERVRTNPPPNYRNSNYNNSNYNNSNRYTGGYCIRCRTQIPMDGGRPYCQDCFYKWNEWQNVDYREQFCHSCGNNHASTMMKPFCRSCFYN